MSRAHLFLIVLLAGACSEQPERRASGVLVTLDTTRVDMLGCYGGPPGVTPNLDELAREALRFERAYTTAPITLPSHASILTGLYPPRHRLHDNHVEPLPQSASTLAERARDAGLDTAAFVAAVVLDPAFGLDQGFERYDSPAREKRREGGMLKHVERDADEVVDAALAWLAARDPERPFFLWVHLFDPHMPHTAPPEFVARTKGRPYLAELAYTDEAVGRLVDGLRAEGLLDDTWLAVVADHGEALGDHGEPTHTITCYEATVRVPLLLRPPDGVAGGRAVDATASVVDLYPTFVRALALGEPGAVDGVDLMELEARPERGVYFESYIGWLNCGWSPLAGWVQGDLKLHASSKPELYDLSRDPAEQENLHALDPDRAEAHRRGLRAVWSRPALERDDESTVSESLRRDLEALGYAASGADASDLPDPLEPGDRPSPTEGLPEWRAMLAALGASNAGDVDGALAGLRAVLDANPGNLEAKRQFVGLLTLREEWEEAGRLAAELIEAGAVRARTLSLLAVCLEQLGRYEEALPPYRRAIELDPTDPELRRALARVLQALGRDAEARVELDRIELGG